MKINSKTPPTTYVGMWDAICEYAKTDELTRSVLVSAERESLDHTQTLVCLAYTALCSREISNDAFIEIEESVAGFRNYVKGEGVRE